MSQPVVRKGVLSFKGGQKLSTQTTPKQVTPDVAEPPTKRPKPAVSSTVSEFQCDGRIVANGTTVQGMETRFKDQLSPGDVIIVLHPQSLMIEERIVTNILSQRSLIIHTGFSSDFMTTSEFAVRKESDKLKEAAAATASSNFLKKEEIFEEHTDNKTITLDQALQDELNKKLLSEKKIFTYREKVGTWGYKNVSVKVDQAMSREDLLDMQQKKVHDKYC